MAFATTNVRSARSLKVYACDYTANAGDADGTITLQGGRVYGVFLSNHDSDVTKDFLVSADVSYSSGTITVTVPNTMDVTTGQVLIFYA